MYLPPGTAFEAEQRAVAALVPACKVKGLVQVADKVDEEAKGNVTGRELVQPKTHSSPFAVGHGLGLVQNGSEDIDVLVDPAILAKLAVVGRVVILGYRVSVTSARHRQHQPADPRLNAHVPAGTRWYSRLT